MCKNIFCTVNIAVSISTLSCSTSTQIKSGPVRVGLYWGGGSSHPLRAGGVGSRNRQGTLRTSSPCFVPGIYVPGGVLRQAGWLGGGPHPPWGGVLKRSLIKTSFCSQMGDNFWKEFQVLFPIAWKKVSAFFMFASLSPQCQH